MNMSIRCISQEWKNLYIKCIYRCCLIHYCLLRASIDVFTIKEVIIKYSRWQLGKKIKFESLTAIIMEDSRLFENTKMKPNVICYQKFWCFQIMQYLSWPCAISAHLTLLKWNFLKIHLEKLQKFNFHLSCNDVHL